MANYTAKIGGQLVNVVQSTLHVELQIGQRSTGGLSIWTALGVFYQYGTQIQVFDETGATVYSGYVVKDKAYKSGSPLGVGYLEHDLSLMDNVWRADKRRVFKNYLLISAGAIVRDLLASYLAAEGVTATASSIATGPTIQMAVWNGTKSVSEAITWLCTQSGYWWQIDLNGVLWFQSYGGIPAPFTMDGTMADATQQLTVEYGNDLYVNKQYAKGAYAEKGSRTNPLHETLHGDSNHPRAFTLSYQVSHLYQLLLNGVDVTTSCLTKGQSGGVFYFAIGDATIAHDPSQPQLSPSDVVDVFYTGRYPVIASAQNSALIAAQKAREGGGTGLVESNYTNTKVRTLAAAFQIASSLLAHYGQDTTIITFSTRQKGLAPGQMLKVNLPDYGLNNRQMLISAVTISDQVDGINVWFTVQAVGSPVEYAQWATYWQNLMNQSSDPTDFVDAQDTALALLLGSTVSTTWVGTVTKTQTACPIFGNATIFNNSLIFC